MTSRLQIMVESRYLEERAPAEGEVERMWSKAIGSWRSSAAEGINPDARFTLGYQAALQASTAVIRAAVYQVRGEGHHYHTFAAVVALSVAGLSEAARELNGIRLMRHGAIYDWQTELDEQDAEEIRTAAWRLFTHAEPWLRARHAGIEPLPTHQP